MISEGKLQYDYPVYWKKSDDIAETVDITLSRRGKNDKVLKDLSEKYARIFHLVMKSPDNYRLYLYFYESRSKLNVYIILQMGFNYSYRFVHCEKVFQKHERYLFCLDILNVEKFDNDLQRFQELRKDYNEFYFRVGKVVKAISADFVRYSSLIGDMKPNSNMQKILRPLIKFLNNVKASQTYIKKILTRLIKEREKRPSAEVQTKESESYEEFLKTASSLPSASGSSLVPNTNADNIMPPTQSNQPEAVEGRNAQPEAVEGRNARSSVPNPMPPSGTQSKPLDTVSSPSASTEGVKANKGVKASTEGVKASTNALSSALPSTNALSSALPSALSSTEGLSSVPNPNADNLMPPTQSNNADNLMPPTQSNHVSLPESVEGRKAHPPKHFFPAITLARPLLSMPSNWLFPSFSSLHKLFNSFFLVPNIHIHLVSRVFPLLLVPIGMRFSSLNVNEYLLNDYKEIVTNSLIIPSLIAALAITYALNYRKMPKPMVMVKLPLQVLITSILISVLLNVLLNVFTNPISSEIPEKIDLPPANPPADPTDKINLPPYDPAAASDGPSSQPNAWYSSKKGDAR